MISGGLGPPDHRQCRTLARFGQKLGHGGKNGRFSAVIFLIYVISGKPDHIARPLVTITQNVQFQVGICSEKFQLDQNKNGRLSAIINFIMPDI